MIQVYIPSNKEFNFKECKKLFHKYKRQIGDKQKFRDIVENSFFYSFFNDEQFIGCIYYYYKEDKLFVNAFANRHTHQTNIECLKMSLGWFNCDIYAKTEHKTAILCLLKCGFKKYSNNIYKYERR